MIYKGNFKNAMSMKTNLVFKKLKIPNGYIFTSQKTHRIAKLFIQCSLIAIIAYLFINGGHLNNTAILYVIVILLIDFLLSKYLIVEERLLMLSNFGLQLESRSVCGFRTVTSIPIKDVKNLLINEGFITFEVIFYIVVILNGTDEIILPFKEAIPKLDHLKDIYNTFNTIFKRKSN